MGIRITVLDAGARYGLHPTWTELRGLADFHLFEMDPIEAKRLAAKYSDDSRIRVNSLALYSENTTLTFATRAHEALSSLYPVDASLLNEMGYKQDQFSSTATEQVKAVTVDSAMGDEVVHFMKLDVEGAECEVLKGARIQLAGSVLGVRSEVLFTPIFDGAPSFGEIHDFFRSQGFELLNLDYTGRGNSYGRFTLPDRYGKLISTDGVWVITNERLFAQTGAELRDNIIRLALFMMMNGATDLAIDLLEQGIQRADVSYSECEGDPIFTVLRRKVLLLLKALLDLPNARTDEITATYRTIFNRDFPLLSKFYQSDDFK